MINTLLLAAQLFINGHAIDASVIETNGTLYVPVDAIARALGVDVAIKQDAIHISSQPAVIAAVPPAGRSPSAGEGPAAPSAPAPAPVTGATTTARPWVEPMPPPSFTAVRGRLTWTQSMLINPPERGAQVWLVPESEVAALAAASRGKSDEPIPAGATGWPAKLDAEYKFLKSVADSDGRFGFDSVAPGSYTLILQGNRANGLAARDRHGKMRFKKLVVHQGEIVDASFNFGVTAYKD